MTTTRTVTTVVDGEPVTLTCTRLTVAEYGEVIALGGQRGSVVKQYAPVAAPIGPAPDQAGKPLPGQESRPITQPGEPGAPLGLRRIAAVDRYVRAVDVVVDDEPYGGPLGSLFGSREESVAALYVALIRAQQPTAGERQHLEVAVLFSHWLEHARARGSESHWVQTGTDCGRCHELKFCARRGCDGLTKKPVVWHHRGLVLHTCPVLSFTPEVEETLRLFYWSHESIVDGGSVRWQQRHLVQDGGLLCQDVWLTSAFAHLRNVHFELMNTEGEHGRTKH